MNRQVTLKADGEGVDPAWTILVAEDDDDPVAQEILGNDLSRRFSTNPGTYFTNTFYGMNLEDLVGSGVTAEKLARIPYEMEAQARDDERIEQVEAKVLYVRGANTANAEIGVRLSVVPKRGQPFDRTFVLTRENVSVLKSNEGI
jgi:hypothetical protein